MGFEPRRLFCRSGETRVGLTLEFVESDKWPTHHHSPLLHHQLRAGVLPLNYALIKFYVVTRYRIELSTSPCKGDVIPLHHRVLKVSIVKEQGYNVPLIGRSGEI